MTPVVHIITAAAAVAELPTTHKETTARISMSARSGIMSVDVEYGNVSE